MAIEKTDHRHCHDLLLLLPHHHFSDSISSTENSFEECIKVEEWWQKTHSEWLHKDLKVAVLCPHLIPKLDKDEFRHYRLAIASLHEIVDALP